MPSVTEVIDYSTPPYLVKWFKNNSQAKCEKIAKETGECGTEVDRLIQLDIKDGGYLGPDSGPVANCLKNWEIIKAEHPEFVPSVKEMQGEVRAFGIVGHFDFLNQTPEEWGITDLKCTSGIREKNWVQEATYARLKMAQDGLPFPDFLRTIRLPQDGGPPEWLEIRDHKVIQRCMEAFDGYLAVFNIGKLLSEHFRTQLEDGRP